MLDQWVKLSLVLSLLLVSLSRDSDSDSVGEISDSLRPDELIEFRINSDIGGTHKFSNQVSDLLQSFGGFSFELSFVGEFVDVDGGIDSSLGKTCSCLFLDHNHKLFIILNNIQLSISIRYKNLIQTPLSRIFLQILFFSTKKLEFKYQLINIFNVVNCLICLFLTQLTFTSWWNTSFWATTFFPVLCSLSFILNHHHNLCLFVSISLQSSLTFYKAKTLYIYPTSLYLVDILFSVFCLQEETIWELLRLSTLALSFLDRYVFSTFTLFNLHQST